MQFLKILFACLAAFVAAAFAIGNWELVPIRLPGGLIAETNLPLLLLVAFVAGFLPAWAAGRVRAWRLRQRLGAVERQLAELRALPAVPAPPARPAAPAPAVANPPVVEDADSATGPGGLL